MTKHSENGSDGVPLPLARRIEGLCRELRRARREGDDCSVEKLLQRIPGHGRDVARQRLLEYELELQRATGETINVSQNGDHFATDFELQPASTPAAPATGPGSEDQLVRILDEYLAELQDGNTPDKAALLAAHPTIAGQLHDCLAGMDLIHSAAGESPLPQQFGRYAVRGTLGKGAFGVVCLAEDTELNRMVALKVPGAIRFASPAELEKFMDEARTAAQVEHPGIVTVHDVFRDNDRVVIVQQYVPGQDLRRHLEESGPLPVERAAELTIEVAEAVAAAHQKGFVHRDLKPGNILLNEQGKPHVADFGLAVHKSIRSHHEGELSGTPEYMSPEQVRGEAHRLDGRSDIWSLGVVLYEMLTGQRPFRGRTPQDLFQEIEHHDPERPSEVRAGIPVALEDICLTCLAKQPADRYGCAEELIEAVRQFLRQRTSELNPISIAVLPFHDMSQDKDQDYFCDGMTEELINRLASIKNLRAVSRMAVSAYRNSSLDVREIGRRLKADVILDGSVREAGSQLRVTTELINVADGYQIWSERFDREMQDVFSVQDEIAYKIVCSLELTLSKGERRFLQAPPTTDLQAYDYYLRGRKFFYQYRRKGIELALKMFSLAKTHDAGFAMAYAGIADCHCFLFLHVEQNPETLQLASEAGRKALELAPDSPEAHVSHGGVLSLSGRHDEAAAEFETAVQLGPHLFDAYYLYARECFAQGKLEKSVDLFRRAYELNPQDYQSPLLVAQCYEQLNRPSDAERARRRGVEIVQERLTVSPEDVRALYMGANGLAALGETEKSLEWAQLALAMEPDEPMVLYNLACIWSLAGRVDEAMDHLETAIRSGLTHKGWLDHDNNLDPLREHPRFQALVALLE